jgi:hypothetical protein
MLNINFGTKPTSGFVYDASLTYALLGKNNTAMNYPYACKDFIQDDFWYLKTNQTGNEYKYSAWKLAGFNISARKFRVALIAGSTDLQAKLDDVVFLVNQFENVLGFPKTKGFKTKDKKTVVLEFSWRWAENGPLLSAYMTLLRIGWLYNSGDDIVQYLKNLLSGEIQALRFMSSDKQRLPVTLKRFAALLQGKKPESKWSDFISTGNSHSTGIYGFKEFPEVEVG